MWTDRRDTTTCREKYPFFWKRKTRQHLSTIDQEQRVQPEGLCGSRQSSYLPLLPAEGHRVDGGKLPSTTLLHGSFLLLDALRFAPPSRPATPVLLPCLCLGFLGATRDGVPRRGAVKVCRREREGCATSGNRIKTFSVAVPVAAAAAGGVYCLVCSLGVTVESSH